MKIYVFSENISLIAELIGCARKIDPAAELSAVVAGSAEDAGLVARMGVEQVCWLGELGDRLVDDFVPTIAQLIWQKEPEIFLVGATIRGRAVAARVAARLGTSAVVNAKTISADCRVSHVVYGGGANRVDTVKTGTLVTTVTAGSAEAAKAEPASAPIVNVAFVAPSVSATLLERTPKKAGSSDIMSAKKVVGVGRGFFTGEDLQYAGDLAEALEGAVGYSRPVTEIVPPIVEGEPYIGVSGITIKPDLYLAVAVSGQTQHIAGVLDSKKILCINSDADAPMFKLSDYGIVGDYKEVIPALVAAISAEKNK